MLCSTYDISDLQAFSGLDPLEQGQGQLRLNFIVYMGLPCGRPLTEIVCGVTYIAICFTIHCSLADTSADYANMLLSQA